jgi:hypothetical protein
LRIQLGSSAIRGAENMAIGRLVLIGAAVIGLLGPGTARANVISGSLWAVTDVAAQEATLLNVPSTTPDVTFTSPSTLTFSSIAGYNVADFLATGGASILTGSAAALSRILDVGDAGTLMELTGTIAVHTGESFTLTHDDGITLLIGGIPVIAAPGPAFAETTTAIYTGPGGDLPLTLVYGECCGPPAELVGSLADSLPEPSSLPILLSSLVGFEVIRRRKFRA